MKTLMKTFGILSLVLAFSTLISCEKDDAPGQTEQLFALSTTVVVPDSTSALPGDNLKKGVIVGTKDEMDAYIDRSVQMEKEVDKDRPVKLQVMKLLGHRKQGPYEMRPSTKPNGPKPIPCAQIFQEYLLNYGEHFQGIADKTCSPQEVSFICVGGIVFNHTFYPKSPKCEGILRLYQRLSKYPN